MLRQLQNNASRIQEGESYSVIGVQGKHQNVRVYCTSVTQRNWSRVGVGLVNNDQLSFKHPRVFIKQSINKMGQVLPELWQHEHDGIMISKELFRGLVNIPDLIYRNPESYLSVFNYCESLPIDSCIRERPEIFDYYRNDMFLRLTDLLEIMNKGAIVKESNIKLPVKRRNYGANQKAINFKGLDIRNFGFYDSCQDSGLDDNLLMFDLGRPYRAPIEEAAAKLLVSIGLLNWGKPLKRFVKGPDKDLLKESITRFKPFVNKTAIQAELQLQNRIRLREIHGENMLESKAKKLGINTIGRHYLKNLNECFDINL